MDAVESLPFIESTRRTFPKGPYEPVGPVYPVEPVLP